MCVLLCRVKLSLCFFVHQSSRASAGVCVCVSVCECNSCFSSSSLCVWECVSVQSVWRFLSCRFCRDIILCLGPKLVRRENTSFRSVFWKKEKIVHRLLCVYSGILCIFPCGFRRRRLAIRPSPWRPIEAQHPTVSSFSSWQFWHSIPVIQHFSQIFFFFPTLPYSFTFFGQDWQRQTLLFLWLKNKTFPRVHSSRPICQMSGGDSTASLTFSTYVQTLCVDWVLS